ncbi:MAG: AMP-binding protein [Gammaproteobacteria bacterium]
MEYYDNLETQDQKTRTETLREALPVQIEHAKERSTAYAKLLANVTSDEIDSLDALATLPVTRKSEMQTLQQQNPPLGGLATVETGRVTRIYQSPGPIYEPEARRPDYWRMARALFAAGFRSGQLVHNTFSYHFTPAGFMFDSGARALGCPVFPAGVGQTELQIKAIADLKPDGFAGTPSFLKIILDKAAELKTDVSCLKRALVGGEALPASLRSEFKSRGIEVYQCYATADLGLIAYESSALEGMIADEGVLIEIVRPGTGDPVPDGEVGELLVTTFNPEYPLIRFATGDLSAILPGESPCGRTNKRIKGWLGRADQTTKVRGMFVHPSQVAEVLKRHTEISKGRLIVDSQDHTDIMTLRCELAGESPEGLAAAVTETIREVCKLRGEVEFVDGGSLPNDGKVIDDIRHYE